MLIIAADRQAVGVYYVVKGVEMMLNWQTMSAKCTRTTLHQTRVFFVERLVKTNVAC